jgi:hypothetical protein
MSYSEERGELGNENSENNVTEDMVTNLLRLSDTSRKIADLERSKLAKEEFHKFRALCKRNLFYLSYSILGNKRLSTNLHGNLCTHIRTTEHERFHSYLLPRGHFKSTIVTIAHAIQIVLPYTKEDRLYDIEGDKELPWPHLLGTDARILIGHETAESAARFLFAITNHFLTNPLLMKFFPDAIPSKRKNRINKWELELPRSEAARGNPEPTIDTLGVGAKSQGRHYNYIKLDDIYGDKARDSAAESENTLQWFDNIQSFFSTFGKDHLDLIGTRYSSGDVYAHAFKTYGSKLISYVRKVEEPTTEVDKTGKTVVIKKPIFPEEFTSEGLEILRKNKKVFSAQYENDPYTGEGGFNTDWKKFFYWKDRNVIVAMDGEKEFRILSVRDLDVIFLIDPGIGSTGGFCVTGMDYLGNVYVLVAIRLELNAPQLTDLVFRQVMRWQPRTVAIESDMFASTFEFWWTEVMAKRGVRFNITPVKTNKRDKNFRISGLTNYAEHGKLFINEKQVELSLEWAEWGKSHDIHILDALAYGPEVWRPGYRPGQRELVESGVGPAENDGVDTETGYSKIKLMGGGY